MVSFGNTQLCEYCLNEWGGEPCRFCGYDKRTFRKELGVLPPGSALMGKYIVGRVIGKGGFGITYLAYDITSNQKVALKEYYPISYSARDDDGCTVAVSRHEDSPIYYNGMKKFYEEASLVAKFNGNPNIVSVREFFYENDTAYFVMELLRGCSLKLYIDRHGCLTPEQALYIADRVSNALMVAHSSNTLHRDIAPDNIMLCTNGNVKLIDFGAARQVTAEDQKSLSVILKQGFAPLEQYQVHGNQGPWTDIYSLGATLYYAVTKKCLEDPMTRLDSDEEFQSNPYNVEPQLWDIIKRATSLRIEDRYRDAFELRSDLSKIAYKPQEIRAESVEPENMPIPVMAVNTPGVPYQPVQPVYTPGVPQPVQSQQSTPGIPQLVQPQQNTQGVPQQIQQMPPYNPYSLQSPIYSPPIKKPIDKNLIAIIGGAAGLVAAIVILVVVLSSLQKPDSIPDYTTPPPSQAYTTPPPIVTTASTPDTITTPIVPEEPTEVTISGTTYSVNTRELDLSGKYLDDSDIQDLKYFKKLEWLELNDNYITDLSVLSSLTSLKHLYFRNNYVSSLSFVSGLTNLEEINCYNNDISDLTPLSGLTNLLELWAGNNPITSLAPLEDPTSMKYLSIRNSEIDGDISPLYWLRNLVELDASGCGLTDLSSLSRCTKLSFIQLSDNYLYDFSPLHNCDEISELILSGNVVQTEPQMHTFNQSMFGLSFAEDAILDIRECGWYYFTIDDAREDRDIFLDNLEDKGYSRYLFEFWATWLDEDLEEVNDLVE